MSFAFTFGSLGDIVMLCTLIKDLIELLDDSRGSAKDYHGVVFRLRTQLSVIKRVRELYGFPPRDMKEAEIQADIRQILQRTRDNIDDFLAKLAVFAPSLANGGSKNKLKDILRKIDWRLQRGELESFERNIIAHTASLDVFIGVTTWYAVESTRDQLSDQIAQSENTSKTAFEAQSKSLRELQAFMMALGRALMFKLNQVVQTCQDIQKSVAQVFHLSLTFLPLLQNIICQLDQVTPFLEDAYFLLVDHLNGRKKVFLGNILSWNMFYEMLAHAYRNERGAKRLARQRFILERNLTNLEIDRRTPWEGTFQPSQVVHLSLTRQVDRPAAQRTKCPKCWAFKEEIDMHCSVMRCLNCDLRFTMSFGSSTNDPGDDNLSQDQKHKLFWLEGYLSPETTKQQNMAPDDSDEEDMTGITRIRVQVPPPTTIAQEGAEILGIYGNEGYELMSRIEEAAEAEAVEAAAAAAAEAVIAAHTTVSLSWLYGYADPPK